MESSQKCHAFTWTDKSLPMIVVSPADPFFPWALSLLRCCIWCFCRIFHGWVLICKGTTLLLYCWKTLKHHNKYFYRVLTKENEKLKGEKKNTKIHVVRSKCLLNFAYKAGSKSYYITSFSSFQVLSNVYVAAHASNYNKSMFEITF